MLTVLMYTLGVVLFELLTGDLPWHGDTPIALANARLTGELAALNESLAAQVAERTRELQQEIVVRREAERRGVHVAVGNARHLIDAGVFQGCRACGAEGDDQRRESPCPVEFAKRSFRVAAAFREIEDLQPRDAIPR